jgi:hypothetical protein
MIQGVNRNQQQSIHKQKLNNRKSLARNEDTIIELKRRSFDKLHPLDHFNNTTHNELSIYIHEKHQFPHIYTNWLRSMKGMC